jgi:hypothetical protein
MSKASLSLSNELLTLSIQLIAITFVVLLGTRGSVFG